MHFIIKWSSGVDLNPIFSYWNTHIRTNALLTLLFLTPRYHTIIYYIFIHQFYNNPYLNYFYRRDVVFLLNISPANTTDYSFKYTTFKKCYLIKIVIIWYFSNISLYSGIILKFNRSERDFYTARHESFLVEPIFSH